MRADHIEKLVEQQLRHIVEVLGGGEGGGDETVVAHTTRSRGADPAKHAARLSNARMPLATRVSCVALPRCGSRTPLSMVRRAGGTAGPCSSPSSAAPAMWRPPSAAARAPSP